MSTLDTLLLSAEQLERYRTLLADKGLATKQPLRIPARAPQARTPLCSYQEPLWFIDRYAGGDTAHNVVYPMGLPEGEIDEAVLLLAVARMIERHEILRTTFRQDADAVVHVVHDCWPPVLERVDLRPLPEALRETSGWKLVDKEAAHQFDLEHGPLIRFTLLTMAPGKHVLLVSLHHIICDTWSVAIIDREVRIHYDDILHGRPCSIPPVAVQFPDYAIWQRSQCDSDRYARELSYWVGRLEDAPQLQLPTDFPVPQQRSHRANNSLVLVPAPLLEKVKTFAQREGVTLYMVLLAAYKIMLSRHTGQTDIMVGTPHANRERDELRDVIGFTINSLVLRTELGDNTPFREAVQRVKTSALEAYEHQDVPFQAVVEALGTRGKGQQLSRYSLFRAFFSVQNIQWADIQLPQINTGTLHQKPRFTVPHPTTKYDIYMYLRERDGKVLGGLEYDVELFSQARVERMIRDFLRVLEQGVDDSHVGIHELPLLTAEELAERQAAQRGKACAGGPPTDIYSCFEEAVRRFADQPALVDEGTTLSYRELASACAAFAALPQRADREPQRRLGILADRSSGMVVSLLAALRAGDLSMLLDAAAPVARIEETVQAHGIEMLLCDAEVDIAGTVPQHLISRQAQAGCGAKTLRRHIPAQTPAFVFMTSGSTGVPNAVVLSHAGVLNGQLAQTCPHPIGPGDRLLLNAPTSSARLVGELLWPLLNGAAVVLCRPGGHQDPIYLGEMLQQHRITHFSVVPQVLSVLLDERLLDRCPELKLVYCVGQNLDGQLTSRFAQASRATLYNSYAQTEACPVSFHACDGSEGEGLVPVGRLAPNTVLHVLDAYQQPVPTGVTGEIAIGGASLAQGYLGNPRLTAEKFMPDPFGEPGARLYRSGDLGTWNERDELVLLGRSDHRVKIRGYRIDLAEIEYALTAIEGVEEAAVVVSASPHGEPILLAYVKAQPLSVEKVGRLAQLLRARFPVKRKTVQAPLSEQLRTVLQAKLPFYMVPARIVQLDELPRGRTGKIDRVALAERESPQEAAGTKPDGTPRTDLERQLIVIWRDVLDLPAGQAIGIYDSFFELGGHSLSAVKIVKRIQSELDVKLEVRYVFEAVTIAGLSELIAWTCDTSSFEDIEL
ncbi:MULTISPECIES: condensation domain-containing protein [Pseudomonas]|uniref:Thioester reductase n=1 Tax=Pseudomonas fluorescens TaxID=294 RepID=A0A0N9WER2_PSEFL|nr:MULTISPECIES: condensation domain-containing protein [Pseudomonas]ALI10217.1 thioester reductase [Pseudomonas fluorescens]